MRGNLEVRGEIKGRTRVTTGVPLLTTGVEVEGHKRTQPPGTVEDCVQVAARDAGAATACRFLSC